MRFTPTFNPREILTKLFRGELSAADLQRAIFIDTLHGQGLMRQLAKILRPRSTGRDSFEFGKNLFGAFFDFGLETEFFKDHDTAEFDSHKTAYAPITLRAMARDYSASPPNKQGNQRETEELLKACRKWTEKDPTRAPEILDLLALIAPSGHKGALAFVEDCYQRLVIDLRSGRTPNPELVIAYQLALQKLNLPPNGPKDFLHQLPPILFAHDDRSTLKDGRLSAILDWMRINTSSDDPRGQFIDEAELISESAYFLEKGKPEDLLRLIINRDAVKYFPANKLAPLLDYLSDQLGEGHPEFSRYVMENTALILQRMFSKHGWEFLNDYMAPMILNILRKTFAAGDRRLLEFMFLIFELESPSLEVHFCQLLYEKGFTSVGEIIKRAGRITELQKQTIETAYALLEGGFFKKYRLPERDEPGFSNLDLQMGFDFVKNLRQALVDIYKPSGQASFRFLYHTSRPIVKATMRKYIDHGDPALKKYAITVM
ncbi:MAG: hypothetical protein PHH60_00920, partial [Candidatus Margulisbacteria bacterium]|nr:hypothetical protein [Candidatus Margulisiibacteriota bacterium]